MTSEATLGERERTAEAERLHRTRQTIATVPVVSFSVFAVLWAIPATREWPTGRDERNPLEIITFLAVAIAGVLAIRLAIRIWQLVHSVVITAFFVGFAALAFAVAGDELAWGQVLVDLFRDGAADAAEAERGLHELSALREHTDILRFGFALVGIVGVFLTHRSRFRFLKVPMELLPWLVVIGAISLIDILDGAVSLGESFSDFLLRASELTEMMIAVVVLLYIWERTTDMWFRIP